MIYASLDNDMNDDENFLKFVINRIKSPYINIGTEMDIGIIYRLILNNKNFFNIFKDIMNEEYDRCDS